MQWDSVFIPINENHSHWYSAYIDFHKKHIHIYDSWSETCLINRGKPVLQRKNTQLMLVRSFWRRCTPPWYTMMRIGLNVACRTTRTWERDWGPVEKSPLNTVGLWPSREGVSIRLSNITHDWTPCSRYPFNQTTLIAESTHYGTCSTYSSFDRSRGTTVCQID